MLREEKISQLAHKVADRLIGLDDIELLGDRQTLEFNIREAILDDFDAEADLEDEITKMLEVAMRGQSRDSVNYAELFKKAKKELAKKRGMTL